MFACSAQAASFYQIHTLCVGSLTIWRSI